MPRTPAEGRAAKPHLLHRQSSTLHYQTFPTAPPRNAGRQSSSRDLRENGHGAVPKPLAEQGRTSSDMSEHQATPLPKGQLAILAVIALAEQTALNSISPYLPDMARSFPEVDDSSIGLYVGLIASAFAMAQFATGFLWGWLSDRIGRKPIVLLGTILTAACFVAFGFCRTLWQAILVQALMGLVNGNQGVISTCVGEITDRSNQSQAFVYLPVLYGLGGITGPLVGGLLVMQKNPFNKSKAMAYPYLLPNLFSAAVLLLDFVLTAFFLEESLEGAKDLPPLGKRVESIFSWMWQFAGQSHRPTYTRRASSKPGDNNHYRSVVQEPHDDDDESGDDDEHNHASSSNVLMVENAEQLSRKEIFNRNTVLLLVSYLIFQLSNISYNSLYPIFSEAGPPTGRDLTPEVVGLSLALAGVVTIVFQVAIFGKLREKVGNKTTYRVGLAGFVLAFLLMPWVGYKDGKDGSGPSTKAGKIWLYIELGVVLIIKTVASVGGLTSALLMITNSAPSHAVLGTVNGLAQTLSAAGRAVGPFISGALFSAATYIKPKGEALAFGIFGGISFLGLLMSFGIRGAELEAEGWDEGDESDEEEGEGSEASHSSAERRR